MTTTNTAPACPLCKAPMKMRTSRHGAFYGCSKYPACKGRIDARDASGLAQGYALGSPRLDALSPSAPAVQPPAPLPSVLTTAIHTQAMIKVPGKRMTSQYGGVCACGANFIAGQNIVFREGKVRGCPACELGVRLERDRIAAMSALPGRVRDEIGNLTAEQRAVAEGYTGGYARLLAAAGSGKTRTLAVLVGRLVATGVNPARILAMTFTRKGAEEMTQRLSRLFGPALQDVAVGTLHSFSGRWLGHYYKMNLMGVEAIRIANCLDGNGRINRDQFDEVVARELPRDPNGIARALLGKEEIGWLRLKKPLEVAKQPSYFLAEDYLRAVGWLCANIIAPDSPNAKVVEEDFGLPKLVAFYTLYLEALTALGVSAFDEWVYLAGRQAKENPDFVRSVAEKYDYVIIDEAQDNAQAQLVLADKVASAGPGNLLLIGDARQAVYAFRGAMPEFIVEAEKYTGRPVKTLHLTGNFRSSLPIVQLGNEIAHGTAWSVGPPAQAARDGAQVAPKDALTLWRPATMLDEGELVARVAKAVLDSLPETNPHMRPLAVLSRTNGGLGPTEAALLRSQIPYVISSGSGFFNRWEIRTALAYMALASGVNVTAETLKLAASAPYRKIAGGFFKAVVEKLAENELDGSPRTGASVVYAMRQVTQRQSRWAHGGNPYAADVELIVKEPGVMSQAQRAVSYVRDHLRNKGGAQADADDNRLENLRVLSEIAVRFESLAEVVRYGTIGANASADSSRPAITLSTVHKCVHPDTLVETPEGLRRIGDLGDDGWIATPEGIKRYRNKVTNPDGPALAIATRSRYSLTVTPEHGMTVWRDGEARLEARQLKVGDLLRVRLGRTAEPMEHPALPPAPENPDTRAKKISTFGTLTADLAELLGLLVADGTIYARGFRHAKAQRDVCDRVAAISKAVLGVSAKHSKIGGAHIVEVNSTEAAKWLLSIGGLAPHAKAVPECVLRAPRFMQARFLRGLFEDGTVNRRGEKVDHVHLDSTQLQLLQTVQVMLLRFGIIAALSPFRPSGRGGTGGIYTLYIYGHNAKRFRDEIGFVSAEKNARLVAKFGNEEGYTVPLTRAEANELAPLLKVTDRQNARSRRRITRHLAHALIEKGDAPAFLIERMMWHYEPIREIVPTTAPSMCVEVPDGHRFLQNGFDGWNSKGLEWPGVIIVSSVRGHFPHEKSNDEDGEERRIEYVAVTRARDRLVVSVPFENNRKQMTMGSRTAHITNRMLGAVDEILTKTDRTSPPSTPEKTDAA